MFFFVDISIVVDGKEVLELFKKHNFDLIISDINMPKVTGIKMLKEFRKVDSEISVLIFSAHIIFEIIEYKCNNKYNDIIKFVKRFREYNVKIAINNLGNTTSNFKYILAIQPDYLMIDGSLINLLKDTDVDEYQGLYFSKPLENI